MLDLIDSGAKLSCDIITTVWHDKWRTCPLCEATYGHEGIMKHEAQQ